MKCAVFGGGGFIGSAVADRLLLDGNVVRIFERPGVAPYRQFESNEKVEWIEGDFSNPETFIGALAGIDIVVHLISTTLPKTSNDDPVHDVHSNVIATLQLLDTMVKQSVRRVLFISSGGTVYGVPKYLPIDEAHPTDPIVSYGITKLAIEKYLHLYRRLHGLETVTLRVSNPYGQRQRVGSGQGAVGVFVDRAIRRVPIEIWGDGSTLRDYIHVDDVAAAFSRAVAYRGSKSVFNIGSGVGVSLNELIALLGRTVGRAIETKYTEARAFDVPANVLSNQLAKDELGWEPSIALKDGLANTVDWQRHMLAREAASGSGETD
jgi:UDP-glucose 4-epimerase